MKVSYSHSFVRMFAKLPESLQVEVLEKIDLLSEPDNHELLKVHKLKGKLRGSYSFSVNYRIRIVFMYLTGTPKEAVLLAVGDHDVYE